MVRGRFVATVFCGPIRRSSDRAKGFGYVWNNVAYRGIDREKLRGASHRLRRLAPSTYRAST